MTRTGKGLLLAASTRDDELTALAGTRAAHRLPVANRPLLSYGLAAMQASGVEDVAVIVSPGTAADVRRRLLGGSTDGAMRIGCLDAGEPQGLVHALRAATHFLDDRPVMVHLGDALISQPLPPLSTSSSAADARRDLPGAQRRRARRAAAGTRARARCAWSQDKPVPPAEQALAGVFVLGPAAIDAALALPGRGRACPRSCARSATRRPARDADRERLVEVHGRGRRAARGEPDGARRDRARAWRAATSRRRASRAGSRSTRPPIIERSTIRGPAVIGPRAVLQDAFVGPYSAVGTEVRLEGAELEHSIVLDHAVIRHIGHRLEDSLVRQWRDRDARLRLPLRPAAARRPPGRSTARLGSRSHRPRRSRPKSSGTRSARGRTERRS